MAIPAKKEEYKWGVWVWIKWKQGAPDDAWKIWENKKDIKEAWSTSGEWDCVLWVEKNDPDEVEKWIWKDIRSNKWVEKTETHWAKKWW